MTVNGETKLKQYEPLQFQDRLLPPLPSDYVELSDGNSLVGAHGAMPANPFLDEAVKQQQLGIESGFLKLYETPPQEMPADFVENVVVADYIINKERRTMDNFGAYMEYVERGEKIDDSLLVELEGFERGQNKIEQTGHLIINSGIEKGEFGKVTHPYRYRMQEVQPFRTEASAAIVSLGGVVYPTITPYRSIKIIPKVIQLDDEAEHDGQKIVGFVVKYKRDYGHIPVPGNNNEVLRVVERQIAAYRVDKASGFDQEVLKNMYTLLKAYPGHRYWRSQSAGSGTHLRMFNENLKKTGCVDFIEGAVQADSLDDFVVPISTTIYGYKEKLPEKRSIDHVAQAALESTLNTSLDLLPGAHIG
ncbi:MAG: hypothetical protein ABI351_14060 [Herbaspirillum sp.]